MANRRIASERRSMLASSRSDQKCISSACLPTSSGGTVTMIGTRDSAVELSFMDATMVSPSTRIRPSAWFFTSMALPS